LMATYFRAPQPAAGWVYGSMRASGFFMTLLPVNRRICR
jgi:mannose/fructose/N-acetylgalactosamine-specific phosphotransferase system component IID